MCPLKLPLPGGLGWRVTKWINFLGSSWISRTFEIWTPKTSTPTANFFIDFLGSSWHFPDFEFLTPKLRRKIPPETGWVNFFGSNDSQINPHVCVPHLVAIRRSCRKGGGGTNTHTHTHTDTALYSRCQGQGHFGRSDTDSESEWQSASESESLKVTVSVTLTADVNNSEIRQNTILTSCYQYVHTSSTLVSPLGLPCRYWVCSRPCRKINHTIPPFTWYRNVYSLRDCADFRTRCCYSHSCSVSRIFFCTPLVLKVVK